MYVGMSENYNNRLKEHNSGKTQSTKAFIPWVVIYTDEFMSRAEAREREKYLKSAAGRRWRNKHLNWPRGATE